VKPGGAGVGGTTLFVVYTDAVAVVDVAVPRVEMLTSSAGGGARTARMASGRCVGKSQGAVGALGVVVRAREAWAVAFEDVAVSGGDALSVGRYFESACVGYEALGAHEGAAGAMTEFALLLGA